MLDWCDPWKNPLLLGTTIENCVQEEDSNLKQMIYLKGNLGVKFNKLMADEQILRKLVKCATLIGFLNRLTKMKEFNR